ncbi:hypothetical protein BJF78_04285 [Pseudonocardia sp. CNS-139]|nr:hypothetical protein BJF78_04285 [Pseudonocardia sp. CNS-139]
MRRGGQVGRKYRVGVTADEIIEAAVLLTGRKGLDGWSVRELVSLVGTSPSVVYLRVGDRAAVCHRVVHRVLPMPSTPLRPGTEWKQWFTEALLPLRTALRPYPGVARWILLHGIRFPGPHEDTPTDVPGPDDAPDNMDRAFGLLRDAGFGDDAGLVFALIMNSALTTIALADDRLAHPQDGAAGHVAIRDGLRRRGEDSVFGTGLGAYVDRFAGPAEDSEAAEEHYYRTIIQTILDGVEARLRPRGSDTGARHLTDRQDTSQAQGGRAGP